MSRKTRDPVVEVTVEIKRDIVNHLDWMIQDMRLLPSMVDAANLGLEIINLTDEVAQSFDKLETKLREVCQ